MEEAEVPELPVALIRDYRRVNRALVERLEAGAARIRLTGVEGQRLLAAGIQGPWMAHIEIDGEAGPELAAGLNAPGLTLLCRGPAADGAAANLKAGRVVLHASAGDAAGIGLSGGCLIVHGPAGHRAGLRQQDGAILLLNQVGRLAGDRQAGGRLFLDPARAGAGLGRGRTGGWIGPLRPQDDPVAQAVWRDAFQNLPPD